MIPTSFETIPSENRPIFPVQEPRKNLQFRKIFMKTALTKKQKVTEVYYNAKDPTAEVYTHDTNLKNRLLAYPIIFLYAALCASISAVSSSGGKIQPPYLRSNAVKRM